MLEQQHCEGNEKSDVCRLASLHSGSSTIRPSPRGDALYDNGPLGCSNTFEKPSMRLSNLSYL